MAWNVIRFRWPGCVRTHYCYVLHKKNTAISLTPPKFNMEPENNFFQIGRSFSRDLFSGSMVKFRGCTCWQFCLETKQHPGDSIRNSWPNFIPDRWWSLDLTFEGVTWTHHPKKEEQRLARHLHLHPQNNFKSTKDGWTHQVMIDLPYNYLGVSGWKLINT